MSSIQSGTRRRLARATIVSTCLALFLAMVNSAAEPAGGPASPDESRGDGAAAELTGAAFAAALAAAHEAKPDGAAFVPSVQKAAPRLRLVEASTEPGRGA